MEATREPEPGRAPWSQVNGHAQPSGAQGSHAKGLAPPSAAPERHDDGPVEPGGQHVSLANGHAQPALVAAGAPTDEEARAPGEDAAGVAACSDAGALGGSAGGVAECTDARAALALFRAAAERRGRQYGLFNAGFQEYLHTRDEAAFRRLMAETTAEFQLVNAAVRAVEAQLAGRLSRSDLAVLLRAVQEGERDKLRFTLVLQALKKAFSDGNFTWQQPDSRPAPTSALRTEPGGALEHGHATAAPPGHSCCGTAPEATEAEYRAAVAEATQARALLVCQAHNVNRVSCAV